MDNQLSGLLDSHCTGNASCPLCSHPYSNQFMSHGRLGYAALQNEAFMSLESLRRLENSFSGQLIQNKIDEISFIDDVSGQINETE